MGTIKKIQRAKCVGCIALKTIKTKNSYTCKLGVPVSFTHIKTIAMAPKPMEPCYKPTDLKQYTEAKKKDD